MNLIMFILISIIFSYLIIKEIINIKEKRKNYYEIRPKEDPTLQYSGYYYVDKDGNIIDSFIHKVVSIQEHRCLWELTQEDIDKVAHYNNLWKVDK